MQSFRQIGIGLFFLLVTIYLVAGGYVLATSQVRKQNEDPSLSAPASTTDGSALTLVALNQEATTQAFSQTATAFANSAATNTPEMTPTVVPDTATVAPPPADTATALATACPIPAGWFPIAIGPNDTLDIIANAYKITTTELMQGNCMTSTDIKSMTAIYVTKPIATQTQPVQATTAAPAVPAATSRPTSTSSAKSVCGAPASWIGYTVVAGDTLYNIGWRYKVTVQELQTANCLGSSTNIRVGQTLKVPNVATNVPLTTATKTSTPGSSPTQTPLVFPTYTPVPATATTPATATPSVPVSPTPTTFSGVG